ncbi:MAG: type II toxin-antitoxin system VapC family toxin [Cyanobium sp.]
MHLLLDTHLLVWRWEIRTPAFSVASLWELVIKQALGRPLFNVQPAVLRRALLEAHHALAVASLPPLHRDPFDRLLLAQASADGLLLITADTQLAAYPGPVRFMAAGGWRSPSERDGFSFNDGLDGWLLERRVPARGESDPYEPSGTGQNSPSPTPARMLSGLPSPDDPQLG